MKHYLPALAVIAGLALAGCGGDAADEQAEAAPSTAAPTTSEAAELTLKDICPQIESALPELDATATQWEEFLTLIDGLSGQADLEAQNALKVLRPGAQSAFRVAERGGMPIIAEMDVSDSVGGFAERCKAAGSSALQ